MSPQRRDERRDVVVVGAGLAGLSAARRLHAEGRDVVVLEARDRVGGRTWSAPVGEGIFDLGGQWIGPGQDRVAALVEELGIKTHPTFTTGRKVLDLDGVVSTYAGKIPSVSLLNLLAMQLTISRVEGLARGVSPLDPASAPRAAELDGMSLETFKRQQLRSPVARGLLDAAIRVVFGAEPSRLSALYFLSYLSAGGGLNRIIEAEGGAQQDRLVGGAQQLSEGLAAPLGDRVRLDSPALAVEQDLDEVVISTPEGRIRARYAILALPPPLVSRLDFHPALPPRRHHLLQAQAMGATVKALAVYDAPFWRARGLSGEAVATSGPVTVVYDNTDGSGQVPCLLAFIVGEVARTWAHRPEAERRQLVLGALARYFGDEALSPAHYHEQDWSTEAWTGGCPVANLSPGVLIPLGSALREPVGRLHWAGTETAVRWTGYMDGALESGARAAAEVLDRLG